MIGDTKDLFHLPFSFITRDSVSVGQCITKLDDACGQTEVMAVTVTRKMLASVLQMMTMVCRQIEARGGWHSQKRT